MEAHIGGVVFYTTFHMNVHALGKTKPPSGGSQGVLSTLATNKQTNKQLRLILNQLNLLLTLAIHSVSCSKELL